MNFSLISRDDSNYHKVMMQKHWDQKRRRKQYMTQIPQLSQNTNHRSSNIESITKAGQTVLNSGIFNSPMKMYEPKKKQVNEENEKMKKFIKDQLEQSLAQQENIKLRNKEESRKLGKVMSTENGMLDYLQKQIEKRDNFIRTCLVNQQIRKNHFFDEDLRKQNKIETHVLQNYDPNRFYHESQKYQQVQKQYEQVVNSINNSQLLDKKVIKQQERSQYRKYLDDRYVTQKHNPITNPMEYHIENPYLRRRIQKY